MTTHLARIERAGLYMVVWSAIVILSVVETQCHAQSPQVALPSFSVATVKPGKSGDTGFANAPLPNGMYIGRNLTVKQLIQIAYDIPIMSEGHVCGGPAWADSARFDIEGKEEQPVPAEIAKIPDHYRLMLQALLADRFNLKIHRETRDLPAYALVVLKSGPKFTLSPKPSSSEEVTPSYAFGSNVPKLRTTNWRGIRYEGNGSAKAMHETSAMFARDFLPFQPEMEGRVVVDRTGLTGEYDFELRWTPGGVSTTGMNSNPSSLDTSQPPLFVALQEQLGLKLEPIKVPTDVIVIDAVEKPSVN